MKTHIKHLANRLRATVLLCGLLAAAAHAAVPIRWSVDVSRAPQPVQFTAYRGETLSLAADFHAYGKPLDLGAATVALYYQTNGMDQAWWNVSASAHTNRIEATFTPSDDPGADSLICFLGSPATSYRAAFRLRFVGAPGAVPNDISPPVTRLDFSGIEVANAPWATPGDVASAAIAATNYTDAVLADYTAGNETDPVWSAEKSSYALKVHVYTSAAAATNYVDAATNALAMSTASALGSYLPLSGGMLSGDLAFSGGGAIAYTGVWGVRLYANAGTAGNRIYTNDGDTWQSERGLAWYDETTNHVHAAAVAATNYTDSSISPTNPAFAAAVRNVPITGADSSDLAEIAEYGSYGTVGAAILALIAGLAALKRGKFDIAGETRSVTATYSGGTNTYKFAGGGEEDDSTVARIGDIPYKRMTATEMLLGVYGLVTRAVTGFVASSGATTATFGFGSTPGGDTVIDCLLDVDNSGNSSDFGLEFHGLGTSYALAVNADDVSSSKTAGEVLAEMTVVEKQTRARFYFTEANQTQVATVGNESVDLPILTVQRMTIAPTTIQGGAS